MYFNRGFNTKMHLLFPPGQAPGLYFELLMMKIVYPKDDFDIEIIHAYTVWEIYERNRSMISNLCSSSVFLFHIPLC